MHSFDKIQLSQISGKMSKLSWYVSRFQKMSFAEMLYRIQGKCREGSDFLRYKYSRIEKTIAQDEIGISGVWELSRFAKNSKHDTAWKNLIDQSEKFVNGEFNLFNEKHTFEKELDFHCNYKSKKQWPQIFSKQVDIRDGFTYGGAKFVWEINRLYPLSAFGFSYAKTHNIEYREQFFNLLRCWMKQNPYMVGVNWTSGIELSVRIVNLLWGLSCFEKTQLSRDEEKLLCQFLYQHATYLWRYPSKYSSNNNHAIAEALGLFLVGVFCPGFRHAEKWKRFGIQTLERECLRQILEDGGSYEYSTTYLSFVFDFFLLFKIVCDHQGIPYDKQVDRRLEQACDYISSLMDCRGNIANIGDQDSAVLVNFGLNSWQNFTSILNTGAVLFKRDDLRQSNFPDIKTAFLTGVDQAKVDLASKKKTVSNSPVHLKKSGLSVIRKQINGKELFFTGNATPLGMPPLYAHGHLDALSFTLSVDGRQFFVDPGTYLYHSGGKWRQYFRSTSAHNTIVVNGSDLTEMTGDFMFGKPYKITNHEVMNDDNGIIWEASHNAYQCLDCCVEHKRQVRLMARKSALEIHDRLAGKGSFQVSQHFHLHPKCKIDKKENILVLKHQDTILEMKLDDGVKTEIFEGSEKPIAGWYSENFNEIERTTTIVASRRVDASVELTTVIAVV